MFIFVFYADTVMKKINMSIFTVMVLAIFFRLWRVGELMVFSGETNNLFYYLSSYLAGEKPWLLGLRQHNIFIIYFIYRGTYG